MSNIDSIADDILQAITESEIDTEYPNCGKDISFTISEVGSAIVCPHCGAEIELESE